MRSFLNLFRKKPVDSVTVLGKVGLADAATLQACPLFPEGKVAEPFRSKPQPYPFRAKGQNERMLIALSRRKVMTNSVARELCGGSGSNGDRRLRTARAWLKANGYRVNEQLRPSRIGRPHKAVWLDGDTAMRLYKFLEGRRAGK